MKCSLLLFAIILGTASFQAEWGQQPASAVSPVAKDDTKTQVQADTKKPKHKAKPKPLAKVNTTPGREAAVDMTRPTKQDPPPK
jgi:hypothetical protein